MTEQRELYYITDPKDTNGINRLLGRIALRLDKLEGLKTTPDSAKNPPIDADLALYRDSTAANTLVTSTWAQIKAFLKTYFDTLYNKYTHPNHSGEVTSVADGAQTIATAAVTLAKMANMATASILGRNTAGVGVPEVLSVATTRSLLGLGTGDSPTFTSVYHSGSAVFTGAAGYLLTDSTDGSDNKAIAITGGGGIGSTRGSLIVTYGNEHATNPGDVRLVAGDTGDILITGNVGIDEPTPSKMLDIYNGASGGDILCYDIYTHDGGVQTSDERDKEEIVASKLGLDFINRLNPIQYRWKDTEDRISYVIKQRQVTEVIKEEQAIEEIVLVDGKYVKKATIKIVEVEKPLFKTFGLYDEKGEVIGEHKVPVMEDYKEEHYDERETKYLRTHCGFVAQEVAKVLEDMGLSNKDFAGYIYEEDRDKHGLRYTEFIGPIVAALKELNEKLEKLNT